MKTAWIFPGGSARAVYTAGVIYALCDMDIPRPDIIIGCSGSAPTSLCYVSGQKDIIKNVWCNSLSTTKFVSFLRFWKIVDIDYLIDFVLKKNNPLNLESIRNSKIDMYFPLTDSHTGELEYFSSRTTLDIWEVMRACVSVPLATNLFSVLGNKLNNKYYSDSIATTRFQVHVKKAINEGAERVIVFDNWHPEDNKANYLTTRIFVSLRNKIFKRNQYNYLAEIHNFKVPTNVSFALIQPQYKLGMSHWEINNDNANKIFNRGYEETIHNNKLIEIYGRTGRSGKKGIALTFVPG
jgi:predicted patatin/cPLA2 family phospholipase